MVILSLVLLSLISIGNRFCSQAHDRTCRGEFISSPHTIVREFIDQNEKDLWILFLPQEEMEELKDIDLHLPQLFQVP